MTGKTRKPSEISLLVDRHLSEVERMQSEAPTPERAYRIVKIKQWALANAYGPKKVGMWLTDVPPNEMALYVQADKTEFVPELLDMLRWYNEVCEMMAG